MATAHFRNPDSVQIPFAAVIVGGVGLLFSSLALLWLHGEDGRSLMAVLATVSDAPWLLKAVAVWGVVASAVHLLFGLAGFLWSKDASPSSATLPATHSRPSPLFVARLGVLTLCCEVGLGTWLMLKGDSASALVPFGSRTTLSFWAVYAVLLVIVALLSWDAWHQHKVQSRRLQD